MKEFDLEKKGYNRAQVDEYLLRREQEVRRTMDDQLDRIRAQRKELDEAQAELTEYRAKEKLIASALIAAGEKAQAWENESRKRFEDELDALKAFHEKWIGYYKRVIAQYPLDATLQKVERFNTEMERVLTPGESKEAREAVDIIARTAARTRPKPAAEQAARGSVPERKETKNAPEAQFDDEARRLGGINMAAVTEVLAESTLEDPRYDGIAATWNAAIPPKPVADYLNAQIDPRTGVNASALHAVGESGFSFEEALHPTEELGDIMADLGLGEEEPKGKKKKK